MASAFFMHGKLMSTDITVEKSEPTPISMAEFFESTPPNQLTAVSDLVRMTGTGFQRHYVLKTPEIQIHCSRDSCNGIRFYRCTEAGGTTIVPEDLTNLYLTYECSNCQKSQKTFALMVWAIGNLSEAGKVFKYGEAPVYGPPVPARLLKLVGPDRENFLKGRRCENQGLGVGAFTYYRRVVEHQKDRIFTEILKVSEKIGAPNAKLELLKAALTEHQFTKALDMAKDAMPESLLINGHSPLKLLHRALSDGIHNLSDEDCLSYAGSIRVVLGELSDRLAQALKDEAEITHALARLLAPKPNHPGQ